MHLQESFVPILHPNDVIILGKGLSHPPPPPHTHIHQATYCPGGVWFLHGLGGDTSLSLIFSLNRGSLLKPPSFWCLSRGEGSDSVLVTGCFILLPSMDMVSGRRFRTPSEGDWFQLKHTSNFLIEFKPTSVRLICLYVGIHLVETCTRLRNFLYVWLRCCNDLLA